MEKWKSYQFTPTRNFLKDTKEAHKWNCMPPWYRRFNNLTMLIFPELIYK